MTYDLKLKNGSILRNIPDTIDQNSSELKSYAKNVGALDTVGEYNISPTPQNEPSAQQQGTLQQEEQKTINTSPIDGFPSLNLQPGTTLKGMAGGVVRELAPIGAGALIGGAPGAAAVTLAKVAGDPITGLVNNIFGTDFTEPSAALEILFDKLGVADAKTEAERIVRAAAAGAAGAGGSIALGKTLQMGQGLAPTIKAGIGKVLATQPAQQIAGGIGSGVASQGATEAGANPVVQGLAGLAGGVVGSNLANIKTSKLPTPPIQEANKAGVRVLTSDVRPPQTFASKLGQSIGEKIPVAGTGPLRKAQQLERIAAVKDLARQYGADDITNISDDIMDDLIKTRTSKMNQYSSNKNDVIKKLSSGEVPINKTTAAIDKQINKLQGLKTQELTPVIEKLNDFKTSLQGQDLANVETLRKQLGESFKAPELANVRTTGEKALSGIYGALKEDMTDYIRTNGGEADVNKWMVANKQLSNIIGELDNSALKRVLNKGEATPEIINNMLFSKNKSDVEALYKNLSPNGKALTKTAVIARAMEKAQTAGNETLSPDKFSSEVKRLATQTGVLFEGDDLKQVQGLIRVLDATKRAGQASVTPPTGIQNMLPVGAAGLASFFGGGIEGFTATLATGAGLGGMARLYESKPIRDLLIKLPTVSAGSAQEYALFKRLTETARAVQNTKEEEK